MENAEKRESFNENKSDNYAKRNRVSFVEKNI
jgi:hypothetical protein